MKDADPAILLSAVQIHARVADLAAEISRDYAQVDDLLLVAVLKGAFIFLADLSRALTIPRSVDFIALSSYGKHGTTSDGVRLLMDLREPIAGKHVLIVEDIVDSGRTLKYLLDTLRARRPASLEACVLTKKPSRLEVDVPVKYLGFELPDAWVVGYGLDYKDRWRTLPYIGTIEVTGAGEP